MALIMKRKWPILPREDIPFTCLTGILAFMTSICIYIAVSLISLSSAQSVYMTSNLISGIILFAFFAGDKFTLTNGIVITMCISGVILVVQPDFLFQPISTAANTSDPNVNMTTTDDQEENLKTNMQHTWSLVVIGYILPIFAGVSLTLSFLILKRRPSLNKNLMQVLFWTYFAGTVLSIIAMAIFEHFAWPQNWMQCLFVFIHCVTFVFTWPLSMYAIRYISGNTINIVYSTTVVFMLIFQYTVLSSILPGKRNWMEGIGVALVVVSCALGSVVEMIKSL